MRLNFAELWIIAPPPARPPFDPRNLVISWSFFPVSLLAIAVKDRRVVVGCLLWLIALYPLSAVWH